MSEPTREVPGATAGASRAVSVASPPEAGRTSTSSGDHVGGRTAVTDLPTGGESTETSGGVEGRGTSRTEHEKPEEGLTAGDPSPTPVLSLTSSDGHSERTSTEVSDSTTSGGTAGSGLTHENDGGENAPSPAPPLRPSAQPTVTDTDTASESVPISDPSSATSRSQPASSLDPPLRIQPQPAGNTDDITPGHGATESPTGDSAATDNSADRPTATVRSEPVHSPDLPLSTADSSVSTHVDPSAPEYTGVDDTSPRETTGTTPAPPLTTTESAAIPEPAPPPRPPLSTPDQPATTDETAEPPPPPSPPLSPAVPSTGDQPPERPPPPIPPLSPPVPSASDQPPDRPPPPPPSLRPVDHPPESGDVTETPDDSAALASPVVMTTYDFSSYDAASFREYLNSRYPLTFSSSSGTRTVGSGGSGTTTVISGSSRPRFGPGRHRPLFDNSLWGTVQGGQETSPQGQTEPNNNTGSITGDLSGITVIDDLVPPKVPVFLEPHVKQVDLLSQQNRLEHHTDQYEAEGLILRRGQAFTISLQLDKPYNAQTDSLKLQLAVGDRPQASRNTLVRIGQGDPINSSYWGWTLQDNVVQHQAEVTTLTLRITSAADAVVGTYRLFVDTGRRDEDGKLHIHRYKHPEQFILLFNAWCKDDQVYMENEEWRQEYVLTETGRIFIGTYDDVTGKPWNFGQMDKVCLDATLYLLEVSYLDTHAHSNPTLVVRALSSMANNMDGDTGVLMGNWSGQYAGGTSPVAWNGSVRILETFMDTRRPVKFGQCWVFSGLLTTLCRSLGIPTRSVTNFLSAHDKDFSMTIDQHVSAAGIPLAFMDDSIWNFHVWNEVWLRRLDLPDGNDGWQAIDSTPQEASEGVMRCGPAPVAAIKEGNVYLGYDTKFVFAEVNGDQIHWLVEPSGDLVFAGGDPNHVGRLVATKAPGSAEGLDITKDYKYPEGSEEERRAVRRASLHSSKKNILEPLYNATRDVKFDWKAVMETTGDVNFTLVVTNTSSEERHINVKVNALATYYTGTTGEQLDSFSKDDLVLHAGKEEKLAWSMAAVAFFNRLDEDATVGSYILAKVKETEQIFTSHEVLVIKKPNLQLEVMGGVQVKVGQPVALSISFTNPLAVSLTSTMLHLEGPGVQRAMALPIGGSVQPGKTVTKQATLTPRLPGKRELIANLNCQQLTGITGVIALDIQS